MKTATTWVALQNRCTRQVAALVCVGLFVALQVFASSPLLHKAIHPDARSSGHHCAITLLAQGQVNAPAAWAGLVAFVSVLIFRLPALGSEIFSSFDYRLSPSRAPPLS